MSERELPNSLKAEAALLAIFLHDKEDKVITECWERKVGPLMFYNKKMALVACACFQLYTDMQPITKENVIAVLKQRNAFEKAGGEATINDLDANKAPEDSASYYIEIIRDKAFRRDLIKTASNAVETKVIAEGKPLTEEEIIDAVTKAFQDAGFKVSIDDLAEAEACRSLVQGKVRELFEEAKKQGYRMRGTLRILTRLVDRLNKRIHGT